jgi:hypothetical protein
LTAAIRERRGTRYLPVVPLEMVKLKVNHSDLRQRWEMSGCQNEQAVKRVIAHGAMVPRRAWRARWTALLVIVFGEQRANEADDRR